MKDATRIAVENDLDACGMTLTDGGLVAIEDHDDCPVVSDVEGGDFRVVVFMECMEYKGRFAPAGCTEYLVGTLAAADVVRLGEKGIDRLVDAFCDKHADREYRYTYEELRRMWEADQCEIPVCNWAHWSLFAPGEMTPMEEMEADFREWYGDDPRFVRNYSPHVL